MTHEEKLSWMALWAARHGCALSLNGEVGFGRDCVGITAADAYPDYEWFDDDFNRVDNNGEVWIPKDAYHKHPCVAVLGRGEHAEAQLYEWLHWFDQHGFTVQTGHQKPEPRLGELAFLLGKHRWTRMVKP